MAEAALKRRFEFSIGIRFELIYSLAVLQRPDPGTYGSWVEAARASMPEALLDDLLWFGNSSIFWILVGDALGNQWFGEDIYALFKSFQDLDPHSLQIKVLDGAVHDRDVAGRVVDRTIDLAGAITALPVEIREWLEHIELYPPTMDAPAFRALIRCLDEPEEATHRIFRVLRTYYECVFEATWRQLKPGLKRSLDEKQRLFEATSLQEFFRLALIRVEVDSEQSILRALRGGYTLPYDRVRKVYVIPSFFNHNRYWTGFDESEGEVVFLPYFDHEISLAGTPISIGSQPTIDVTLIFNALGDPTRIAIASLIARKSMSSTQLANTLGVTRPTISHHVMLLREAGLLEEESRGNAVYLSLARETLEKISQAAVKRFFGA